MQLPGFIGPAYTGRSTNINAQRCVNLYPELDPTGKNVIALHGTPGLELFSNLGASPIRGEHVIGDLVYAVTNDQLKSVNAAGTSTGIGTLTTTSGRVSMADNGTQLMIVDGSNGYIYDTGTSTFTQISDPDFGGGDTVTFMDGYFIVSRPGTGIFQISALYDGLAWAALDVKTAEGDPDNLLAVLNDHRELWAFGENTTEVYFNSGNSDFPFDRLEGAFIEWGLAARWSLAKGDNSKFFLARNKRGEGKVIMMAGYNPQYISTTAIEYQIAQYSAISDAFGYCYIEEGHTFYVLTFPSGNATWVYDTSTRLWHERQSYGIGRHRVASYVYFNKSHLVGDYSNGNLYKMKMDVYTDNGGVIESFRVSEHIDSDENYQFFHNIQVVFEAGVGLTSGQGDDPQAMLSWSDDGGHVYGPEHWTSIGKKGKYKNRAIWRRLGRSRDRVFKVKITDPVKRVFIKATVDVSLGAH